MTVSFFELEVCSLITISAGKTISIKSIIEYIAAETPQNFVYSCELRIIPRYGAKYLVYATLRQDCPRAWDGTLKSNSKDSYA